MIRVAHREARTCWDGDPDLTVVATAPIGFDGAAEEDRRRWLNGFRRLLDGLDAPLQVVIRSRPGSDRETAGESGAPRDRAAMRAADIAFAAELGRSRSSQTFDTLLITPHRQAGRLESALQEMGIPLTGAPPINPKVFGTELPGRFQHPGGFSRCWYVERLPGTEIEPGWLFQLIPAGLQIDVAWHATPLPAAWIVGYLQRQLINMRASRLVEQDAGVSDPILAGALPNAEELQRRLASSQDKAFHVSIYLTLTAASREELELGAVKVEGAAKALLCEIQPCTFRMLDGYLASHPGGPERLQRKRVLDTTTLVTFFPWKHSELQQRAGLVVGRHGVTGAPVLVDPFDQSRHANANIGVFGHSGAGKTYLLSTIVMGALGCGAQVYVVDPEYEYGALADGLGGVDIQLALGSGHALNVLDLDPTNRHNEAWLGPAVADAVDLCACICGSLDESERALVETAVRSAYEEVSEPVLRDVADRLRRESRTAVVMRRWVSGSLGRMFSAPTNVDLEAPMVVFGMRELRDEMIGPVHFLLAEALWTRIKRKDRRRVLVIDELGLLFEDPTIRKFVVSLARRIRKYDGSLVFATQNPGDLLATDQGAVVATNPALLFLGAQRPGEAAKLEDAFRLSPRQRFVLESGRRGDFLLVAGPDRLPLRVQAPPWQEEAMRMARTAARPPRRSVG